MKPYRRLLVIHDERNNHVPIRTRAEAREQRTCPEKSTWEKSKSTSIGTGYCRVIIRILDAMRRAKKPQEILEKLILRRLEA
jgi:hypothetical protein